MAQVVYEELLIKYSTLIERIDKQISGADKNRKPKIIKLKEEFNKWMREVPTIGFNSAKYDCNIMKKYLYATLNKYNNRDESEEKDYIQVLKTGNS